MKLKAVLFDLDGTLIDSVPDLTRGVNRLLSLLNKPPLAVEDVSAMVGKGAATLLSRALAARDLVVDEETLENYLTRYKAWVIEAGAKDSVLLPGVKELMTALKEKGIKRALVTNKPRAMTESVIQEKGIDVFFDVVITPEDVQNPKPAGDMLRLACSKLDVNPQEAVMVGDSGNDALAAQNAGMSAVLLKTGYNEGAAIDAWAKENGFDEPVESLFPLIDRFTQ